MKTKSLALGVALVALAFAGCGTVPQSEILTQAEATGYGAPLASSYQETIKAFMETQLRDPANAVYKFGTPEKGWVTKAPVAGGGLDVAGYLVPVQINATNGFGGYTGFQEYGFLLRDNRVVRYKVRGFWQSIR